MPTKDAYELMYFLNFLNLLCSYIGLLWDSKKTQKIFNSHRFRTFVFYYSRAILKMRNMNNNLQFCLDLRALQN